MAVYVKIAEHVAAAVIVSIAAAAAVYVAVTAYVRAAIVVNVAVNAAVSIYVTDDAIVTHRAAANVGESNLQQSLQRSQIGGCHFLGDIPGVSYCLFGWHPIYIRYFVIGNWLF